jgi:hypothetical protein
MIWYGSQRELELIVPRTTVLIAAAANRHIGTFKHWPSRPLPRALEHIDVLNRIDEVGIAQRQRALERVVEHS